MHDERTEGDREALDAALAPLVKMHGLRHVHEVVHRLMRQEGRWRPTCGERYDYTYYFTSEVPECPPPEDLEEDLEERARQRAEARVRRYCRRNPDCTEVRIVRSYPAGGGCQCADLPLVGRKCFYLCIWKVEYECVQRTF